MLVRKARLFPESFANVRDRALQMLDEEGEEAQATARAFGAELILGENTSGIKVLARAATRFLLPHVQERTLVQRLTDLSADAVLRTDICHLSNGRPCRRTQWH